MKEFEGAVYPTVSDIRGMLKAKYQAKQFDASGNISLYGVSFIADEGWILRKPNQDYIRREIDWYLKQSLSIEDMEAPVPAIWKQIASDHNEINSNYGYLVFSDKNGNQYSHVLDTLRRNADSRKGTMVYIRPSIHKDWNRDGMSDFICTLGVTYFITGGKLNCNVQMRSNDLVYGYNNDWTWQRWVMGRLVHDLGYAVTPGEIIWSCVNAHVYPRHFHLFDEIV